MLPKHIILFAAMAALFATALPIGAEVTYRTIAMTGHQAPGAAPGQVYKYLWDIPAINDAGQTAFFAFMEGPGADLSNSSGIWSEGSGSLSLVARKGYAAPDTAPGVVLYSNDYGILSDGSGSQSLVARTGDAAPGTGPGLTVSGFNDGWEFIHAVFNGAGRTAFLATVTGTGVGYSND